MPLYWVLIPKNNVSENEKKSDLLSKFSEHVNGTVSTVYGCEVGDKNVHFQVESHESKQSLTKKTSKNFWKTYAS